MTFRIGDHISTVLFDIDDTLLDHHYAVRHGSVAWLRRFDEYAPRTDDELFDLWMDNERRHYGRFERGEISHQDQRCERVREMAPRMADASRDALLAEFSVFLDEYSRMWRPLPGAVAAVQRVEAANLKVGFLSNAELTQQQAKLTALGLGIRRPLFVASHLIAGKPDQRAYAATCAGMGVEPGETLMIGDSPTSDYQGALDAGLDAVLIEAKHHHSIAAGTAAYVAVEQAQAGQRYLRSLDDVQPD